MRNVGQRTNRDLLNCTVDFLVPQAPMNYCKSLIQFHILNNLNFFHFQPQCNITIKKLFFLVCAWFYTVSVLLPVVYVVSYSLKVVVFLLSFVWEIKTNCNPYRVPFLLVSLYSIKRVAFSWFAIGSVCRTRVNTSLTPECCIRCKK